MKLITQVMLSVHSRVMNAFGKLGYHEGGIRVAQIQLIATTAYWVNFNLKQSCKKHMRVGYFKYMQTMSQKFSSSCTTKPLDPILSNT